jgi:hypothetical protein
MKLVFIHASYMLLFINHQDYCAMPFRIKRQLLEKNAEQGNVDFFKTQDLSKWIKYQAWSIFDDAARGGHLPLLQYLYERLSEALDEDCYSAALERNHFHVVEWLHSIGIKWNESVCADALCTVEDDDWHIEDTDQVTRLKMLQWLRSKECPWNVRTLEVAILENNKAALEWCLEQGCPVGADAATAAVSVGDLKLLKRLVEEYDCPVKFRTMTKAVEQGDGAIVQYLMSIGCDADEAACAAAARHGHLDILKQLRAQDCPWISLNALAKVSSQYVPCECGDGDDNMCVAAAEGGHLDILQYVLEQGCVMDQATCNAAASAGHLHIIQYAAEQNIPLTNKDWPSKATDAYPALACGVAYWTSLCDRAALRGDIVMLDWLVGNGVEIGRGTVQAAAEEGHIHVLEWLWERHCPWDAWAFCRAISNDKWNVVHWLKDKGCVFDQWAMLFTVEHSTFAEKAVEKRIALLEQFLTAPWHPNFTAIVAYEDDLEVLKWAAANRCSIHESTGAVATQMGHTDIHEWCVGQGCPLTAPIEHGSHTTFRLDDLLGSMMLEKKARGEFVS